MEFGGIRWNSVEFGGIRWNSVEFGGIRWEFGGNSVGHFCLFLRNFGPDLAQTPTSEVGGVRACAQRMRARHDVHCSAARRFRTLSPIAALFDFF